MSGTNCKLLNPLQRDGTSRNERAVEYLDPAKAPIDERDPAALLVFAHRYAQLIRYYDAENDASGDWVDFLAHDISTLVALVRNVDHEAWRDLRSELTVAAAAGDIVTGQASFTGLLRLIEELAQLLDRWYRDAVPGLALHTALKRLVDSVLADALQEAAGCAKRASDIGLPDVAEIDTAALGSAWSLGEVEPESALFPDGDPADAADLAAALEWVGRLCDSFLEALIHLVEQAPGYFQETVDSHPEHEPHMALFLAFLNLYEYARQHLNTITARHLGFYYGEVLQLEHRDAVPDQVHLIAELAKHTDSALLATGSVFSAGKDAAGGNLFYAADADLVANRTSLDAEHGLKSVFLETETDGCVLGIHAAGDADSQDGLGAALTDIEGKWETYGSASMPAAEIGFALASPMFLLAEGMRTVKLTIKFDQALVAAGHWTLPTTGEIAAGLQVHASAAKEWLALEDLTVTTVDTGHLVLKLDVGAEQPAVVAYDAAKLDGGFQTKHPVVKFSLADGDGQHPNSYLYDFLRRITIKCLDIEVTADGIRSLVLENDVGSPDPAKPFQPFGPIPRVGSAFLVGHHEAFQKSLTSATVNLIWADLPQTSFETHYAHYTLYPDTPGNDAFKARVQVLTDGAWQPDGTAENPVQEEMLFDDRTDAADDADLALPAEDREIKYGSGSEVFLPRDPVLPAFKRFDGTQKQGFLRFVLGQSFLHGEYPSLLAGVANGTPTSVNAPYTPLISELTFDYIAQESDIFRDAIGADYDDRVEQVFQIGPFGQQEVYPVDDDGSAGVPADRNLVPDFTHTVGGGTTLATVAHGTLYLGLKDLAPPQILALLCQVAEGSEDPQAAEQPVVWSYLAGHQWVELTTTEIVADGTNGFLNSGIVQLDLPATMTKDGTLLPTGLHWLRATVAADADKTPRLVGIHPQALTSTFADNGNDLTHLETALPDGTIKKLQTRQAAIKKIDQPYASFGGRPTEADAEFRVRVSERLRHKERAITIFDYERLVLEQFPAVHKIKCVNHTSTSCEHAPGRVRLVAVPDLRNRNAVDPLAPRLSQADLREIREFLQDRASDFVTIEVTNPDYEQVKVKFSVRLHTGYDQGFYTSQLQQDIVRYLSPWLYDEGAELTLGGRVHRSAILNHVEKQPYVDFVTDFQLVQIGADDSETEVTTAMASTSSSAIVSIAAEDHEISHDIISCQDEDVADGSAAVAPVAKAAPVWPGEYLGNSSTRELHDVRNLKRRCQIKMITIDRRYFFKRQADAAALGYDLCAYCFGRDKSKR